MGSDEEGDSGGKEGTVMVRRGTVMGKRER